MKLRATFISLLVLAFGATSAASAVAVPNAVDQYTEQPPSAGGGGVPQDGNGSSTGGNGSSGGGSTGSGTSSGGGQSGASGSDDGTGSGEGNGSGGASGTGGGNGSGGGQAGSGNGGSGSGPASQLEGTGREQVSSDSSNIGIALPIILLVIAGAVGALAYSRRRSSAQTQG